MSPLLADVPFELILLVVMAIVAIANWFVERVKSQQLRAKRMEIRRKNEERIVWPEKKGQKEETAALQSRSLPGGAIPHLRLPEREPEREVQEGRDELQARLKEAARALFPPPAAPLRPAEPPPPPPKPPRRPPRLDRITAPPPLERRGAFARFATKISAPRQKKRPNAAARYARRLRANPAALRQAIVLREVLGPPAALRRRPPR